MEVRGDMGDRRKNCRLTYSNPSLRCSRCLLTEGEYELVMAEAEGRGNRKSPTKVMMMVMMMVMVVVMMMEVVMVQT